MIKEIHELHFSGTASEYKDWMRRLEIAFGNKARIADIIAQSKQPRILAGYEDGKFIISITQGAQTLSPSITSDIFKAGYKHDNLFVPMKIGARFSKPLSQKSLQGERVR